MSERYADLGGGQREHDKMLDLRHVGVVEVTTEMGNDKLWINVDGQCVLRIYGIRELVNGTLQSPMESSH
jgi:hypothetical protein